MQSSLKLATRCRAHCLLLMLAFSIMSLFFSLSKGSTSIPIDQLLFGKSNEFNTILYKLRLPRTATAFVTGSLLALSGALMQLLLQNPLADPYLLGISGGAALMTLCAMLLGASAGSLVGAAWLGSGLSMLLVFAMMRKHRWQAPLLVLSGVAIAFAFSAGISIVLLMSPDKNLHSMLFWLSGDLNDANFPWTGIWVLLIGSLICVGLAPGLNLLNRGEQEAQMLGLAVKRCKVLLYLLSAIMTATAVTLAGCIGFVGLIVPHLARRLAGHDHRVMLPVCMLMGGALLTCADTLARTLLAPQQLPVGLVMTLIGIPIFIGLLQR